MKALIVLCLFLLLAYLFDLFSDRLSIPSVLVLLFLGLGLREGLELFRVDIPDLFAILPGLGQVGLVLIVLEGALELDLGQDNLRLARTSFFSALTGIVALSAALAFLFSLGGGSGFKSNLLHGIALSAISSAVAIAACRGLKGRSRAFVIYESSFSDILAVLFFNFVAYNTVFNGNAILVFVGQIALMAVISTLSIYLLFVLLNRIVHHVKFIPIILLVILIYLAAKELHLPALIFILLFGLFLNNFEHFGFWPLLKSLSRENNEPEVKRFMDLVIEFTFLIRSLFFLVFGFSLSPDDLLKASSFLWALMITVLIFGFRWAQMKAFGLHRGKVFYFAPRGLITILLFISIAPELESGLVGKSLVFQVILLTSLVMLFGVMRKKRPPKLCGPAPPAAIPRS